MVAGAGPPGQAGRARSIARRWRLAVDHPKHSYADDAYVLAGESWAEAGNRAAERAAYEKAAALGGDMAAEARRRLVVGAFVLAAVVTPPDVVSQLGLALPMLILYEISIISARLVEKKRLEEEARREAEEAAESASAKADGTDIVAS